MAATIRDVARHAGVARSTVSYVLSGKRAISQQTQERVRRSIVELGFHPHAGARSVRAGRSGVVALSLPMVHGRRNSVQMPHVWAALTAAQEAGLRVLVLVDDDGETAVREAIGSAMVDGVILMEVGHRDSRVPLLAELDCPAVVVGSPAEPRGLVCVDFDFDAAAAMSAAHLYALGHRRVGYLGQPAGVFERNLAYAVHTRDAVLASLGESGGRPAAWTACDSTPDGVLGALKELLDRDPEMTGLIVYNERALPLVPHQLTALGYRVPQDISVIGIGYDDEADNCVPPLTSVTLSADTIARTAVASLTERIAGETVPPRVLLAPTLNIRSSTGPAAQR